MKFFFYGTLRMGERNNKLLQNIGAKYVGPATTAEKYVITQHDFWEIPMLLKHQPPGHTPKHISGEVWEVSEEKAHILDRFEGHPYLYKRDSAPIKLDNGEVIITQIYFFNQKALSGMTARFLVWFDSMVQVEIVEEHFGIKFPEVKPYGTKYNVLVNPDLAMLIINFLRLKKEE